MASLITEITEDQICSWWEKLPHREDFWGDYAGTDYESFRKLIVSCPIVVEMPFGILRVSSYEIGHSAEVHGLFWSSDLMRNPEEFENAANLLRDNLHIVWVEVFVPSRRRALRRLLAAIGFSEIFVAPGWFKTSRGCFAGVKYARLV